MHYKKKSLNLSFISHEFPPIGGGASTALDALTRKMTDRGHLVQILSIGLGYKTHYETDRFGRKVIRFGVGRKNLLSPSARELARSYAALRFKAPSYLRKFSPNVLTAFFAFPAGHAALSLGKNLNLPVIVSLRGSDVPGFSDSRWGLFKFSRSLLLRPVWKQADLLLANGSYLSHLANKFMPTQQVINLPNGVNTNIYHPSSHPSKQYPLKILFIGQLIERKRCLEMLRGVEWLAKQNIRSELTIIGEGPLRIKIEAIIKNLPTQVRVILKGHVARDKLPEIYRQHDVLLLLSKAEGVSNVLLEALASGLCIIASPTASHNILKDTETGILIDSITPSAVGSALLTLAQNYPLRIKMKKKAREQSEKFDWNVTAASFDGHILSLLKKREE